MKEILKAFKNKMQETNKDKKIRELRRQLLRYEYSIKANQLDIELTYNKLQKLYNGIEFELPAEVRQA